MRLKQIVLLTLFLLLSVSARAATFYVTSTAIEDPAVTVCTLGAPCHLNDALRLAANNGQDDSVLLAGPSTFVGQNYFYYSPFPSDRDRNLSLQVVGGLGLFDGSGQGILLSLTTAGNGTISVDGITLRNAGGQPSPFIGLVLASDGDVTVRNVSVSDIDIQYVWPPDPPDYHPAALLADAGRVLRIEDSRFERISTAAVRARADRMEISGSSFVENGDYNGLSYAAVDFAGYSASIINSHFQGNKSASVQAPGALDLDMSLVGLPTVTGQPTRLTGNVFIDNNTSSSGGAVRIERHTQYLGEIEIDHNLFRGNKARSGGGLYLSTGSMIRVLMRNNVFFDNEVDTLSGGAPQGAAVRAHVAKELRALNNTISFNTTHGSNSGAMHVNSASLDTAVVLHNNILRHNRTTVYMLEDDDLMIQGDPNATVVLRNNNIGVQRVFPRQTPTALTDVGRISADPGFVDDANRDLHLLAGSALIDAGTAVSSYLPTSDMDGQTRIQNGDIDVGADEFSGLSLRTLSLSKVGTGQGSVASVPAGVACGYSCGSSSGSFDQGTTVGLMALADTGSQFVGWGGDCTGTMLGTSVVMNTNQSCTAQFDEARFSIRVTGNGPGMGSVGADHPGFPGLVYPIAIYQELTDLPLGSNVTFTAGMSDSLHHLIWSNCESLGGQVSGNYSNQATCALTNISSNMNLDVTFNNWTILFPLRSMTIQKTGSGSGAVSSQPAGIDCGATCQHDFGWNTQVQLSAIPDSGSRFAGWSGDCTGTAGGTTVVMDDNKTCQAQFEQGRQLTVEMYGDGEETLADQTAGNFVQYPAVSTYQALHNDGGPVTITATTGPGQYAWFLNCDDPSMNMTVYDNASTAARCEIGTMNQNALLDVMFFYEQYMLTLSGSGTGSGTVVELNGHLVLDYPLDSVVSTPFLNHGTQLELLAQANGNDTVHWVGCNGPGTLVIGEGTSVSTCYISLYSDQPVEVEFRPQAQGDEIFSSRFQ